MGKANGFVITLTAISFTLGLGSLASSTQVPGGSSAPESPALRKSINGPRELAYDPKGFLYVHEVAGNKIIRLDLAHGTVTTVALPPEYSEYSSVVAMDKSRNLLLADNRGDIGTLDVATGIFTSFQTNHPSLDSIFTSITTDGSGGILGTGINQLIRWTAAGPQVVAGTGGRGSGGDGGLAVNASFYQLMGVAVNAAGDIFVADSGNCRIREIDSKTRLLRTIAGTGNCRSTNETRNESGPATLADLDHPVGLICDEEGDLFFVEDDRVRRIDKQGVLSTYAGTGERGFSGDGGLATAAKLESPWGLATDENGNLYIADYGANRIRRVDAVTHVIRTVAGDGSPKRIDVVM